MPLNISEGESPHPTETNQTTRTTLRRRTATRGRAETSSLRGAVMRRFAMNTKATVARPARLAVECLEERQLLSATGTAVVPVRVDLPAAALKDSPGALAGPDARVGLNRVS